MRAALGSPSYNQIIWFVVLLTSGCRRECFSCNIGSCRGRQEENRWVLNVYYIICKVARMFPFPQIALQENLITVRSTLIWGKYQRRMDYYISKCYTQITIDISGNVYKIFVRLFVIKVMFKVNCRLWISNGQNGCVKWLRACAVTRVPGKLGYFS